MEKKTVMVRQASLFRTGSISNIYSKENGWEIDKEVAT